MSRFSKGRGRSLLFTGLAPRRSVARKRTASLGDIADPVTLSVRELQQLLVRAGWDVGRRGVDGQWGADTQGALDRYLDLAWPTLSQPNVYDADPLQDTLVLAQRVWVGLRDAPPNSGGERQSRTPSTSTPSTTTSTTSSTTGSNAVDLEEDDPWWKNPWIWGSALAFVGAAGVVYLATREPKEEELDEELLPAF